MLDLPQKFIIFDTEYTAWEGSFDREWSGPGEHKELVQIAAAKVEGEGFNEADTFSIYIRPRVNPKLSDFFINLTGITQEKADQEGVDFEEAIKKFTAWSEDLPLYSFGDDVNVLTENCKLLGIDSPFDPGRFSNIRELFKKYGIPADDYMSSTIVRAFGQKPARRGHEALNDVRTVIDGLKALAEIQAKPLTSRGESVS